MRLNWTSELKVIVVWSCDEPSFSVSSLSIYYGTQSGIRVKVIVVRICSELLFSISSVSIYYGTQSDIWVKSYCRLNLQGASIFKFEHLKILRNSIGHPSKKLFSFEFAASFHFKFWASLYITGLNRTFELKVIVIWIG